jgi:hypothetical protein
MQISIANAIQVARRIGSAASIITNGLKMWLGFQTSEVSGANQITPDLSGNSNVGKLYTGTSLNFNTNDAQSIQIDSFQMSGSNATFAFWIKPDLTTGFRCIFDVNSTRFLIRISSGNLQIFSGSFVTFGSIASDQWQRVVIVINGTSADAYINEVQSGVTQTITAIDMSTATQARIGANFTGAGTLDAKISDFQIYNAVWSADDIAYDYAKPNHLVTDNPSTSIIVTNLKAYWALSEGAGLVAYDSGTNLEADLILDGNFPLPNTNWNLRANAWTVSDNKANMLTTSSQNYLSQSGVFTVNAIKTYQLKFDAVVESGRVIAQNKGVSFSTIIEVTTTANNITVVFQTTANETGLLYFTPASVLGVGLQGSITNVSVREVTPSDHGGLINVPTWDLSQPRIPQLGMMDWAISTPVSDEVTLVANPSNPSQDILGNSVRLREKSLNLNGSGYAEVADDASINPTTEITIQCWIFSNTETDKGLVAKWKSGTRDYMLYKTTNNFRIYIGSQNETSGTIPSTGWVNIAGTYDGSNLKTFINGELSTTKSASGFIPNNTNVLEIGRYAENSTYCYSERISDVLLYDTALDADEIKNNYKAGLSAHSNSSSFSGDFSSDYGN